MAEERRPAQPRAEPRQDRGTIGPRDLSGIPLEREERRGIMERVRPEGEESMEAQAFSSAVEAQREAEALRGSVPDEDLAYQQRVQEERTRLQQMREDPSHWTVETEPGSGEYRPIMGRDIDVRQAELAAYESGYGEWRGSALGGAEDLDRYAQEMYGSVEAGSSERGRAARDYEKALEKWREQAYVPEAKPRDLEAPKAGSARLYEEAMRFAETDVEMLGGVLPVSSRGVRQIGAVLEGSVEMATTGITGMIPGQQPFEVMPGEETVSWQRLPYEGLEDPTKRNVAWAAGAASFIGLNYAAFLGASAAVGPVVGATGVTVGRLPFIGQRIASTAGVVATAINQRRWLSTALFGIPILAGEGLKVKQLVEKGEPLRNIMVSVLGDAAAVLGTGYGFSRGLSFGKTLPGRLERAIRGGITIPESAFVPGYEGLPRFAEEPFPPTASGYKDMASFYTPGELRIGAGVPSYHATTAKITGDFDVLPGVRPGEYGMFWGPAGSDHFLRLGGGYTWRPGVPDLFSEPRWLYGEFADVAATGLGKASPAMQRLLERAAGTGELFMPVEQMGEAQALLSPGTKMVEAPGSFWAGMAEGPVRIGRYLPETLAALLGISGPAVPLSSLSSSYGAPMSTAYLPVNLLSSGQSTPEALPSLSRRYSRPGPPSFLPPSARPGSRRAPGSELLEPPRYAPPRYRPGLPSAAPPRKRPPSFLPPSKTPPSFTPPSRQPPSRRPPTYRPPQFKPPRYDPPKYRPPWGPPSAPPLPRAAGELGLVDSLRRGFRGKRRTYPIRDPLSLAKELMSPPPKDKRRRRRKGGETFGLF